MLSYANRSRLYNLLERDEEYRKHAYMCSEGKLTVGIGRNLDDRGISHEEAIYLLQNDIRDVVRELLQHYPWINCLSDARKIVLISMAFNIGIAGFSKFRKMLAAIEVLDFKTAAQEMLDSLWAKKVGARAERLAHMMEMDLMP